LAIATWRLGSNSPNTPLKHPVDAKMTEISLNFE
jgi:hypothetical protein